MSTYIGIHTGISEKNFQMASVIGEFQLLTSRVSAWSNLCIFCQNILQSLFVVVSREEHYWLVFNRHLFLQGLPEHVLEFLYALLSE